MGFLQHEDEVAESLVYARRTSRLRELLVTTLARYVGLPARTIDREGDLPFYRYGLSSEQLVQMIRELELTLGVRLPPSVFFSQPTVDALVPVLVRASGRSQPGSQPDPVASVVAGEGRTARPATRARPHRRAA